MKFVIEPINDVDCKIIDCDCSDLQGKPVKELIFPSTIVREGKIYNVKSIGKRACWTNKNDSNTFKYASLKRLKKIIFSEGIEVIEGVMEPVYDNNATERGNAEFLQEVLLPSSLKVIGKRCFYACRKLTTINIPSRVEEILSYAFKGCESLQLFQWPESLRVVELSAFSGMSVPQDEKGNSLFVLNIPDTIESILANAYLGFKGWCARCNVSLKAWRVLDNSQLTKDICSIDIPEGVKKIRGKYPNIKELALASTIREIGPEAFCESQALDCIEELPPSLVKIGEKAFQNAHKKAEIKYLRIRSAQVKVGRNAFALTREEGEVYLTGDKDTMESLMSQPGALNGTAIEKITIPEGSTTVEIEDCYRLTEIEIPNSVKKIKSITRCPNLKRLTVPDSVTAIDDISDNECLEEISLPKNLSRISRLEDCPNLKSLTLPDSLIKLKKNPTEQRSVFGSLKAEIIASKRVWKLICKNRAALKDYQPETGVLNLPEGVDFIAEECFHSSSIQKIVIPCSVKKIEERAFEDCSRLNNVVFPVGSKLKKIGYKAFCNTALNNIKLPENIEFLGTDVFKDCNDLKYVVFASENPLCQLFDRSLGEACDWFVADNKVPFFERQLEKYREEHPEQDSIIAKRILPLSLLKEYIKNFGRIKYFSDLLSKKELTHPISLETEGLQLVYSFPLETRTFNKIKTEIDLYLLAANYFKTHIDEVSFQIEDTRQRGEDWDGSPWIVTELRIKNSSPYSGLWQFSERYCGKLDVNTVADVPRKIDEWSMNHSSWGLLKRMDIFLQDQICAYWKALTADTELVLKVRFDVTMVFNFMVDPGTGFSFSKIKVMEDWKEDEVSGVCNRFCFIYDNRFVGVTSINSSTDEPDKYAMDVWVENNKHQRILDKQSVGFEGVYIRPKYYYSTNLPLLGDVVDLFKKK